MIDFPVPRENLEKLSSYKCTAGDNSITRKYITNHWYEFVVSFMPPWLAPNVVTIIGGLLVFTSAGLSFYFSPSFDNYDVPSWVFFVNGLLFFLYQTMDNCDGKQAGRTNSCSPLGELFDHGIDALVATFGSIPWLVMCGNGPTVSTFVLLYIPAIPFVSETWAEYFTKSMVFGLINGPNEGFSCIYLFQIIGSLCGGMKFYHTKIGDLVVGVPDPLNFEIITIASLFAAAAIPFVLISSMKKVYDVEGGLGIKKMMGLFPGIYTVLFSTYWIYRDPYIFENHPILFVVNYGLMFGYLMSNLTLTFLLEANLLRYSHILTIYTLGYVVQGLPQFAEYKLQIFLMVFVSTVVLYGTYVYHVSFTISEFLGVGIFTVNPKEK